MHGNVVPAELDKLNCRCNKDGEVSGKDMLNNINWIKCRFNKDWENQRNVFKINFFFIWQKVEIEIKNYYGMYGLYYHPGTMSTKELKLDRPLL